MLSFSDPKLACSRSCIPPSNRTRTRTRTRINTQQVPWLISKSRQERRWILGSIKENSNTPIRGQDKWNLLKPLIQTTWRGFGYYSKLLLHLPNPSEGENKGKSNIRVTAKSCLHVSEQVKIWLLCGMGYWVQGFRCFPWLALNFHMAHGLFLSPSTLQLVQNTGNLPMVAKPIYGVLSDALSIGGAHRLPYMSLGVSLQVLSWGTLALIPLVRSTFPLQMTCILLGNLGASFTEVINDALVAEFSKTQKKAGVLQSYAFMALASGGILGNLCGGFFLLRSQQPKLMFLTFTFLLSLQLAFSLTSREDSLGSTQLPNHQFGWSSVSENLSRQFSNMVRAIRQETISRPLAWIVASIAAVPLLSGTMFCFQTQCLNLSPSVIGLSKVIGQIFFLSMTFIYNRYLKKVPMRNLILGVQMVYAFSLLSDLLLVKQINLAVGISNEVHVLCLSALAEAAAQFKILPFTVLLAEVCPSGCEGSLFAFFGSAVMLASIISGVLGVGLASFIGLSSGDYSTLPLGIVLQSLAALVPLGWISCLQTSSPRREGSGSWKRLKRKMKWPLQ